MNMPRLTTRTVEEIEDVIATIDRIFADGVVEPHELDELRAEAAEAHYIAGYADASLAYGMSAIRNGVDARRTRDLARDLHTTYPEREPVSIDHARKTKTRHHRCNGDDAA